MPRLGIASLVLSRYSYYKNAIVSSLVKSGGGGGRGPQLSLPQALSKDLPMSGYQFNITMVPYDSYIMADPVVEPEDPEHYYENLSGFEHSLLREVATVLDFTYR